MNWKRLGFGIGFLLTSLVLALLIIELVLRGVARFGSSESDSSRASEESRSFGSRMSQRVLLPQTWESYFVERYRQGRFVYEGLHRPHPTRGWSLVPSHYRRAESKLVSHLVYRRIGELTSRRRFAEGRAALDGD